MARKKGRTGQKKMQGPKAKAQQKAKKVKKATMKAKAKARKTQSKAVRTNLKKMTFDNSKKIDVLNADITRVLMAPSKPTNSSSDKPQFKREQWWPCQREDTGIGTSEVVDLARPNFSGLKSHNSVQKLNLNQLDFGSLHKNEKKMTVKQKKLPLSDVEMPDVGSIEQKLEQM